MNEREVELNERVARIEVSKDLIQSELNIFLNNIIQKYIGIDQYDDYYNFVEEVIIENYYSYLND